MTKLQSSLERPAKILDQKAWSTLCAAFALDVYRDKHRPALPADWLTLCDCPSAYQKKGYFGAAYYRMQTAGQMTVIIAHRGTANLKGVYEDVRYLLLEKSVPPQFSEGAQPFINYVREQLQQQFPDMNITVAFAGHSLGATLAEISLAYAQSTFGLADSHYDAEGNLLGERCWEAAYTFESPGSAPIMDKMLQQNEISTVVRTQIADDLFIYNADVDAINTCMPHQTLRLLTLDVGYSWISLKDGSYPLAPTALYFLLNFTIKDQHGMQKIYDFFQNPTDVFAKDRPTPELIWPQNAWAAYQLYGTYEGISSTSSHTQYWDGFNNSVDEAIGYIQRVWDTHPEIHMQYENAYNIFYADYKQALIDHTTWKQKITNVVDDLNDFTHQAVLEHERAKQWLEKKLKDNSFLPLMEQIALNGLYKIEKEAREIISESDFSIAAKEVVAELKTAQSNNDWLPFLLKKICQPDVPASPTV